MPTKKTKKTVKKVAKSTKKSLKKSAAPVKRAPRSEHDEFFAQNPSIKPLIIVFLLVAAAAFIWLIQIKGLVQ